MSRMTNKICFAGFRDEELTIIAVAGSRTYPLVTTGTYRFTVHFQNNLCNVIEINQFLDIEQADPVKK